MTSEMQLLPSSALSGGQRSRVALAAVSYTAPHVLVLAGGVEGGRGGRVEGGRGGGSDDPTILPSYPPPTTHLPSIHSPPHAPSPLLSPPPPTIQVLDEPTNNLDLESVASLADCIESFKGGVVLVSHDQYFVGRVAREVWVVDQGTVKKASSFDAYRAAQLAKLKWCFSKRKVSSIKGSILVDSIGGFMASGVENQLGQDRVSPLPVPPR